MIFEADWLNHKNITLYSLNLTLIYSLLYKLYTKQKAFRSAGGFFVLWPTLLGNLISFNGKHSYI